ncbi:BLOC-1-related complex subunit 8-like protein isoform X3 [Senna tora]|uniref:BLOC-1-related complex subunit 8-like protein isoform X3 n=1 Tax=Senna tora TaxID=362788 RepID=A0A834WI35_9FABA|nr:BLOC-1-related complex subunit 8-like protein isoform X3 [Senna tora]
MHGFSTVDGFVDIGECLAEMIKYLANEPSVGLFFVQQHTQKSVPNVIKHKKNLVQKSHETRLHTQDLEDSITMVRSMKECGFPIVEEMIGDIRRSLVTMSTRKTKRGVTHQVSTDSQIGRVSSSRQKSRNLMWPQVDGRGSMDSKHETTLSATSASSASSLQDMEADELQLSSQVEGEAKQHEQTDISEKLLSVSEKYSDFKAIKEAQLEKWLEGTSNCDDNGQANDSKRL